MRLESAGGAAVRDSFGAEGFQKTPSLSVDEAVEAAAENSVELGLERLNLLHADAAAADLNLEIAGEEYLTQERQVERRVRLAYFGALFAERTAGILIQAESIADEILTDRESAFTEGIITRQPVLDAVSKKRC